MFRRAAVPNLQFTVASTTQVESFSHPTAEAQIHISYNVVATDGPDKKMELGKCTDGELVNLAFSLTPSHSSNAINIIYEF